MDAVTQQTGLKKEIADGSVRTHSLTKKGKEDGESEREDPPPLEDKVEESKAERTNYLGEVDIGLELVVAVRMRCREWGQGG